MNISGRLPTMQVTFSDEGDMLLAWCQAGSEGESSELQFQLVQVETTLDIRWVKPERKILLTFVSGQPLADENQDWVRLRRLLGDFWADRQEIQVVTWESGQDQEVWQHTCHVSLSVRAVRHVSSLLTDIGECLRGYLVGTGAL